MDLADGWGGIVAWCQQNAPATATAIRGPAQAEELAMTQEAFPHPWPGELVEWFGLQDGIEESPFSGNGPLPGWVPCSLADVRQTAEDMVEMSDDVFGPEASAAGQKKRAGTQSLGWLPSFVPIARSVAAEYLIVDTRRGPRHGVLKQWDGEDGTVTGPRPSLTKLVLDTANCLEHEKPLVGLIPEVVEGGLQWQDADHPSRARPPALPPEWQGFYEQFRAHRVAVWDDGAKTWPDDLEDERDHQEWAAQQNRFQIMDVIHSVLAREADDRWHGQHVSVLEAELDELQQLAPHLSSDTSRLRTREVVALTMQLQDLVREHPLQS